jgi:NADH dehydrogenase [ubiquinone] 1 alpha subcomplex assembly factor 7
MGIASRMASLISCIQSNEEKRALMVAYRRLISPEEMGKIYKLCLITNSDTAQYAFEYGGSLQ